jgi:hypothetical protein
MVNAKRATKLAFTEEVVECDTRSDRDARPELLPSLTTIIHRVDEMLLVL